MKLQVELEKKVKTGTIQVKFSLENEVLGILGRSGCGKSVTLKCIAGILQPEKGKIQLDDRVLYDSGRNISRKARERRIGYLFQNYALFPNLTVLENICFSLKRSDREGQAYARELMERFYLTEVADSYPAILSGGQQQRTAMARMLAARPEVLLLDEPFSALDSFLRREMEREVREVLKSFGGVSILVSHNKEEIRRLTQRCMVMEQGKIAELGRTEEIFARPGSAEGQLLIDGG
ncbi:MAG TPA: ATP-binding cassette domain-containing protein [Candidatus Fusicatenibacter intestinigallinarum]|uniref:ATP-binding cassette domain-containing protein n=1 Tax=Candidatus Fusicatenibacter intestinigallinarum TaxID=2838598 RepID=A0A9D2SNN4_9FIRM|nr:ATP-binding cassette domain-containing protein [Candidatus Fusicatenibacter intestinigallinarum]